ncbi:MAG: S41 family peptidase [Clostridia bacterium]|nr:S41 family peptidase [Clostridia bacterium]
MEENKTTYKVYKIVMLVILTAFITFLVTSIGMYNYFNETDKTKLSFESVKETATQEGIDASIKKYKALIDKYYLGEIDENALKEGAIKGYIEALGDPYTEYISAEDMKDYTDNLLGNFVGIGIYMVKDENYDRIQVLTPIKNTPAEKAGIQPGDYILKVDGVEYKGSEMSKAADLIKGEEGTTVKLEILRGTETKEYEIKREKIVINPVTSKVLNNNIGYIELTSFDEDTAKHFKEEFEKLQGQSIKSLIIDLRNNGGGIVEEALQIADYIADKDSTLLITTDKNQKEEIEKAKQDPIVNVPIVILVNENTASASEILAGALKDLNKAKLVGTKTYGKGVIQGVMTLTDGSGLKLTTEEYMTPNREKINKKGIEPNEEVKLPDTVKNVMNVKEEEDTQLKKAIELLSK